MEDSEIFSYEEIDVKKEKQNEEEKENEVQINKEEINDGIANNLQPGKSAADCFFAVQLIFSFLQSQVCYAD